MPYEFKQRTLSNGLTIVAEINPHAHSAACGFYVKTGARDEVPQEMGVSHFLEHMMFKGTDTITADELNRRFDAMGARNNAFTSNEMTCFYAHVLPEKYPECLELLGRMMRPALKEADFSTEKGVILEEIAMYEDNPFFVLYEASIDKHFAGHPLSHRVLGTPDTIKALSRDRMQAYFDARYAADNTTVALAGNIDFEQSCDILQSVCGGWRASGVARKPDCPAPIGGRFQMTSPKVGRGYLLAMCDAPCMADERRYAASLLAQILGGPDNSRLHWALVEPGIAEDAQASYDPHDGFGEFFVFAVADPARLEEVQATIDRELATFVDSLSQDDIDRLINKFVTGATVGGERPSDRMFRLGRLWTYLGTYSPLEQELDRLLKVSLTDLREAYNAYPIKPITIGTMVPAAAT